MKMIDRGRSIEAVGKMVNESRAAKGVVTLVLILLKHESQQRSREAVGGRD